MLFLSACASQNAADSTAPQKQNYDIAAYYWPAYHPEPRWAELGVFADGKGEWQNVYEAKPKHKGHDQPRVPLLGYEDESDPAVMAKKNRPCHIARRQRYDFRLVLVRRQTLPRKRPRPRLPRRAKQRQNEILPDVGKPRRQPDVEQQSRQEKRETVLARRGLVRGFHAYRRQGCIKIFQATELL